MRLLIIGAGGFLGGHVRRLASRPAWTWSPRAGPRCLVHRSTGWSDLAADDPARDRRDARRGGRRCRGQLCRGHRRPGRPLWSPPTSTARTRWSRPCCWPPCQHGSCTWGPPPSTARAEPGIPVSEQAVPRPAGLYGVDQAGRQQAGGTWPRRPGWNPWCCASSTRSARARRGRPARPAGRRTAPGRRARHRCAGRAAGRRPGLRRRARRRRCRGRGRGRGAGCRIRCSTSAAGGPCRCERWSLSCSRSAGAPPRCTRTRRARPSSADIPWQQADISRAAEDLGWQPRRDLATSLADLWTATA